MPYPLSIPVFTDLMDDIDDVLAADQNDPNDVITAIATMIGAVGASQSYSIDLLEYESNKQAPIVTKASASTLNVSIGAIVIKNAAQSKRYLKRITGAITVTAANIDTGALADDTVYYVYAIGDAAATTFTIVFSTSATNPAVGSGVIYELIGWFYNESAGALDVTSGLVGNIKRNGRDVPNACLASSSSDFSTASTSFVDVTGLTIQFYSNGRPLLLIFNIGKIDQTANVNPCGAISSILVDATNYGDVYNVINNASVLAIGTHPCIYTLIGLAAGTHTIKAQLKTDTASCTAVLKGTIVPHTLQVIEL